MGCRLKLLIEFVHNVLLLWLLLPFTEDGTCILAEVFGIQARIICLRMDRDRLVAEFKSLESLVSVVETLIGRKKIILIREVCWDVRASRDRIQSGELTQCTHDCPVHISAENVDLGMRVGWA